MGAFVVAWVSFTRGYRFGRGFLGASWRGLLATAVLVMPAYAYTGYRVVEWQSVDVASDEFTIGNFARGESGRYAFVNSHMVLRGGKRLSEHALLVDLQDGSWRRVGGAGAWFRPLESVGYWEDAAVVRALDPATMTVKNGSVWCDFLDTDTGTVIKSGWSHLEVPEVERRFAKNRPAYLGNKRRGWWHGLGWSVFDGRTSGVADPFRQKVYPKPGRNWMIVVRPGRWLVRVPEAGRGAVWEFYDPETGAREETASPLRDFRGTAGRPSPDARGRKLGGVRTGDGRSLARRRRRRD